MLPFDLLYLLIIVPIGIAWWARSVVTRTFTRYSQVPNRNGLTGLEVAGHLLQYRELVGVTIGQVPGPYTDNYDPRTDTLNLSETVMNERSVAAMGVVAHEVGHAVQDLRGYPLMHVRTVLAGWLGWVALLSPFFFIGGLVTGSIILIGLGALMLGAFAIFALITLPVELNASSRALTMLEETELAEPEERKEIGSVLRAAAFTYLASFSQRLGIFLFFVFIFLALQGIGPF